MDTYFYTDAATQHYGGLLTAIARLDVQDVEKRLDEHHDAFQKRDGAIHVGGFSKNTLHALLQIIIPDKQPQRWFQIMDLLLDNGASLSARETYNDSALLSIFRRGDMRVLEHLETHPKFIDAVHMPSGGGGTMLHQVLWRDMWKRCMGGVSFYPLSDVVELLLRCGVPARDLTSGAHKPTDVMDLAFFALGTQPYWAKPSSTEKACLALLDAGGESKPWFAWIALLENHVELFGRLAKDLNGKMSADQVMDAIRATYKNPEQLACFEGSFIQALQPIKNGPRLASSASKLRL